MNTKIATKQIRIKQWAETAKANNLNTCKYFELLLTEMPKHMNDKNLSFLEDLLPWSDQVQKECPSLYKKS